MVSGEGDRRRDSSGGSRRCAWTTKTQTEPANRGTTVELMDGIRSAHLSGGVGFVWNVGGRTQPLTVGRLRRPVLRLCQSPYLSFLQGERVWRVEIAGY